MSSYQDYANAVGNILTHQGDAAARAKEQSGQIWGNTLATLGDVVPKEVQQVLKDRAVKQKTAQIQSIIQQNGGDLDRALPLIMGVDATIGGKLADEHAKVQKSIADVQKIQDDAKKAQLDYSDRLWSQVTDEGSYAHAAMVDRALGGLPLDHYDPEWVKQKKQSLLSLKDQLDANKPIVVGGDLVSPQGNLIYSGTPKSTKPKTWAEMALDAQDTESPTHDASEAALAAHEKLVTPKSVTPGSFEDFVIKKYGADAKPDDILKARGEYGRADDRVAGAQAADITQLTSAGLDIAALNYKKTGVMPALGMGDRTARQRIINRAAELTPADIQRIEAGGGDLAANRANYRADSGSLAVLQKQRDAIGAFEGTAQKNIDNFLEVAKKVPDTGIPLLNTPARWIAGAGGSADMAKYNAARQVAVSEIAKIVQNPNLSGTLSDSARKEIEVFNPANATLGQTVAVMTLLKRDMQNRKNSLDEQIQQTRSRIGGPAPVASGTDVPAVGSTFQGGKVLKVTPVP